MSRSDAVTSSRQMTDFGRDRQAFAREATAGDEAVRWEDYEINFGVLEPRGTEVGRYRPLDHTGLLVDLEKLNDGDEQQALRFAKTWGLMGYRPISSWL